MRDEGFAFARYMLYGRKARAHGHRDLADLFESLADVEVFDYFMHEAGLAGLGSGSDIDNLRQAIADEASAADETYRLFERQARDAGATQAAEQFSRIRSDKNHRRAQLAEALGKLETSTPRPHRILVIADESCHGSGLCDEVAYRAGRVPSEVLIVAPALTTSRLHYLASDLDRETVQAAERLETLRDDLERRHVHTTGRVGDTNPLIAIEDALREFQADEIVIATQSPDHTTWLERDLVDKARTRFAPLLVTHVIVDPALDRGVAITGY